MMLNDSFSRFGDAILYTTNRSMFSSLLEWCCLGIQVCDQLSTKPFLSLISSGLALLVIWAFLATTPGANDYQTGAWRFVASFAIITTGVNICCTGKLRNS
jgi:hypothetical protein